MISKVPMGQHLSLHVNTYQYMSIYVNMIQIIITNSRCNRNYDLDTHILSVGHWRMVFPAMVSCSPQGTLDFGAPLAVSSQGHRQVTHVGIVVGCWQRGTRSVQVRLHGLRMVQGIAWLKPIESHWQLVSYVEDTWKMSESCKHCKLFCSYWGKSWQTQSRCKKPECNSSCIG